MCVIVSVLCHSNDRSIKAKVIAKECGTIFVGAALLLLLLLLLDFPSFIVIRS